MTLLEGTSLSLTQQSFESLQPKVNVYVTRKPCDIPMCKHEHLGVLLYTFFYTSVLRLGANQENNVAH